ncbi:uncharacterized protein LOC132885998 [Neoarius graeffei]|uniref:uncharacterized protein LOC132885998 n=1 Tax=Neoarius graeffei TaxID=443677 RepID=UPI00298CC08A|nr:uncharacterized protein LOC132885998 [Neoarius graeffei]
MGISCHTTQHHIIITCRAAAQMQDPHQNALCDHTHTTPDKALRTRDREAKAKMKTYSDTCQHARPHPFQPGDMVLCSQPRHNKLTPAYNPKPYKVTTVKGTMVTAERSGHSVTRNSSFFKKLSPTLHDTAAEEEDDVTPDVTTGTAPVLARYPARRRQPPLYLRRVKAVVSIQPDAHVFIGEHVTLRCDTQGGGDTQRPYSWYKNNYRLSQGGHIVFRDGTKQELFLRPVGDSDGGSYTCRGQDSEISDAVTLTVSEKPKVTVRVNPQSSVYTGDTITLSCELQQGAGWQFLWEKKNQDSQFVNTGAANTNSVKVTVDTAGETGYRCGAHRRNAWAQRDYYTDYSDFVRITVRVRPKPVASVNPDKQVFSGDDVTLRCDIQDESVSSWQYSWYKDPSHSHVSNEQVYTISGVKATHTGNYTCRGAERGGSRSSHFSDAVTLTVSERPRAVLSASPQSWLTEGDSVTLSCEVTGSSTDWTFSWYTTVPYRSGLTQITNSRGYNMSVELLSDSSRGSGGKYTLSPAALKHTGVYMCRGERGEPAFHTQYSNPQPLWITGESPPVSLIINPNRTQHFTSDSLSLSCNSTDQSRSTGWTVRRYTHSEGVLDCSPCKISSLSTSYTGVYWCHSESGENRNPVNITVQRPSRVEAPFSVLMLICSVVTASPYLLATIILLVKCYRARAKRKRDSNTELLEYLERADEKFLQHSKEMNDALLHKLEADNSAFLSIMGRMVSWSLYCVLFFVCESLRKTKSIEDFSGKRKEEQIQCLMELSPLPVMLLLVSLIPVAHVQGRVKAVVSIQPDTHVFIGERVTLRCDTQGGGDTQWPYGLYKDGSYLASKEFSIRSVGDSGGGSYTCRGRDSEISDAVTLTVSGESPPVSLIINPNRTQHFTSDSLSLSCNSTDQSRSTGWTVRRYTHSEGVLDCSPCKISSLSTSYTGVYWCHSESGENRNPVNITVQDGAVILESPVHPVTEGHPLTLRCLYRNPKPSNLRADFYKDGSVLQTQTTGEMIIHNVSKSDEGFYHCKHPERGESLKSWVSVRCPSCVEAPFSVLMLICSVVTASPYLLATIILLVKCYRARAHTVGEN